MPRPVKSVNLESSDGSVAITPTGDGFDLKAQAGSSGQVGFVQKGPFKLTFADHAALVAGVDLWTAALGDSPQYLVVSVPVTPFDGGTGATVTADSPPTSVPLTIVGGANTFVFTGSNGQFGGGGFGTPETFTIAPGTYSTLAAIAAAVMAAPGTLSDTFGDYVIVTDDGTNIVFTMTTVGLPATPQNGNTIDEGNGGAAAIGIAAPPASFGGAVGPSLGVYINDVAVAGIFADVSRADAVNSYPPLESAIKTILLAAGSLNYIGPALAGLPYVAKWATDPGALTVGECYIYALLFPELVKTT